MPATETRTSLRAWADNFVCQDSLTSTFEQREAARKALAEAEAAERPAPSIDERCLKLGIQAADKDAEAERHWAAEADCAGRAAYRRSVGNDDEVARSLDRERASCQRLAEAAQSEASRLRSQAAALRRAQAYAAEVVSSMAAE